MIKKDNRIKKKIKVMPKKIKIKLKKIKLMKLMAKTKMQLRIILMILIKMCILKNRKATGIVKSVLNIIVIIAIPLLL